MDFRNEKNFQDPLTVLYGHHIRGGRMFSSLEEYRSQEYYEEHPILYLYTPEDLYVIRLFAAVVTDGARESFVLDMDEREREKWLEDLKKRSDFRGDWNPDADGRFIALCTCTYVYDDARYVVYGELCQAEEEDLAYLEKQEEY